MDGIDSPAFALYFNTVMTSEKDLCLIHANCQAEPLMELLAFSPFFSATWEVKFYTNYLKEEIPQEELDRCGLFLHQHLGDEWGAFSSASLTARLNPAAEAVCLPNMFFKGYWPFWTSTSPIDFGDTLLDKLIDAGAQKPEILKIYCYGNLEKFADIKGVAEESLAIEEEKDKRSPVKVATLMREQWREESLFYTCNHPAKRLLGSMANQLLKYLGFPLLDENLIASYLPEYSNFELPVHPQVAEALNLSFVGPKHEFNVFGRRLTFLQYISRYIDCRQQGYEDSFLGYLQMI
jgi:hypothetical protein